MEKIQKGVLTLNPAFWWMAAILFIVIIGTMLPLPMVINAAKYAQVSREILESGDWINLTIGGEAYDQKPPLLFWLGSLFFSVFGVSTAAWKLGVLAVSAGGVYATYRLGKLLYGELAGRLAAFFWACSLGFLYYHNDIHTDTLLADTVIFSVWQLAAFFRDKKKIHFYLGIAGVGLSMLAKGPVGLAIPAFATGTHLLLHRQWKEIFHTRWLIAILIVALMITPALWGLFNQFGTEGIKFYFWTNNMGRITGSYYGKNNDLFFYLHTMIYLLAPFTVFAVAGLVKNVATLFRSAARKKTPVEYYTSGAIVFFLVILSIAKTKNPHYLLPVMPFFMILAARFMLSVSSGETGTLLRKAAMGFNFFLAAVLWIILLLFMLWLFPEREAWIWAGLVIFMVLMVVSATKYHGVSKQVALLSVALFAFLFSLNVSIYPKLADYHAPFRAIQTYNEKSLPGEEMHLFMHGSRNWEIFFYTRDPGLYFGSPDSLPALLRHNNDWVFTDTKGCEAIIKAAGNARIVEEYKHNSLSQIRLPFLLPKTRESKLGKRFLIKLP